MRQNRKKLEPINNWVVYKHISPVNKVYIGITSQNPKNRWGKNGNNYQKGTYFRKAIDKYGWDSFKHIILYTNLSEQEAKNLEIQLIAKYKLLGISYNLSNGGDGNSHPRSEETKQKISKALKGRPSYNRSLEWRQRQSNFMKNHQVFNDEIRKIAIQNSNAVNRTPILQYTLENKTLIKEYIGIRQAAKETGFDASFISKCCRGIKDSAYGYIWEFKYKENKKSLI